MRPDYVVTSAEDWLLDESGVRSIAAIMRINLILAARKLEQFTANDKVRSVDERVSQVVKQLDFQQVCGGADETRTRDLRRDRPAF